MKFEVGSITCLEVPTLWNHGWIAKTKNVSHYISKNSSCLKWKVIIDRSCSTRSSKFITSYFQLQETTNWKYHMSLEGSQRTTYHCITTKPTSVTFVATWKTYFWCQILKETHESPYVDFLPHSNLFYVKLFFSYLSLLHIEVELGTPLLLLYVFFYNPIGH